MPAERYFSDSSFEVGETIKLQGGEHHHLAHVMRGRKGEPVEVVNGKGFLAKTLIQEIIKDKSSLLIQEVIQKHQRDTQIILAQAIPKPNRLDFILEKGTELGADAFWLFPGAHSIKSEFSDSQLERLKLQTIAAMKQSGRLFLPEIIIKPALEKWISAFEGTKVFGDVEKDAPHFSSVWKKIAESKSILFLVGPESGFNEKEIALMRKAGAHGVKLHENILRTDTASLAALSLMSHWLM